MKLRKILATLLLLCTCLTCLMLLTACGNDDADGSNPNLKSKISFKSLTVDGTNVYGKVNNSTETFYFIDEITATGSATYIVSLDIYGIQPIVSKTIPLTIGDNIVYLTEMINSEPTNVYKVTIRRRPMYTVIFNANNGTEIESQTVEEDSLIPTPPPTVTKSGYTFKKWNYDITQPIIGNTTITAQWIANDNTPYKVEYYFENIDDDNYTLKETISLTGTTDTTATAEIKSYEHFTFNQEKSNISDNIDGDELLVLKVYYTRNLYTLSINNTSAGEITNAGTYKYGTQFTTTATVYLGYNFGWYSGEKLISTDTQYTFTVERDIVATYTLKSEMFDFIFTSTDNTCTITGVKDKNITKIVVPDYVTSICLGAFNGCSYLTSITLPFIGSQAHAINSSSSTLFGYIFGTSDYTNGNRISQRYSNYNSITFYIPSTLKSVTITGGSILYGAFSDCSNLTSITIPNSVTSIGYSAFYGCSSLTSITIPNSVTSIGSSAFYRCENLEDVYITDIVSWCNISFSNAYSNPLYNADNLYLNNTLVTEVEITNTVTEIKASAFFGCSSLTSITIPNSVTSIGSSAFYGCSSLTSIKFEDTSTWYVTNSYANYINKNGGEYIDVTNSSINAKYLTSTYDNCYWYKRKIN